MRIAIEATAACRLPRTGIGWYTVRLADALCTLARSGTGDEIHLGYRLSRLAKRRLRHRPDGVRTFWIQEPILPLRTWRFDLVHGTDARVPHWRGPARLVTLHDVFSLISDRFAEPEFIEKKRAAYRELAARCHRIIADSASTRADFLARIDYPADRVDVVPLGVEPGFHPRAPAETASLRGRLGLERPYLLYVGEISARKNTAGLLAGVAACREAAGMDLAIAGSLSYRGGEALARVDALGLRERVKTLGYLPDADLPLLYAGASAFVFPTFYEGFGLPILEAMASGVPVVAGNRGSSPEVASGHAALADPDDPASIAAAITAALARTSPDLEAARAHARGFTWEACARATRASYARAVEEARREA